MSYYKNNYSKVAKVLHSWGRVVVMLEYKTKFFDSAYDADQYLKTNGFYK